MCAEHKIYLRQGLKYATIMKDGVDYLKLIVDVPTESYYVDSLLGIYANLSWDPLFLEVPTYIGASSLYR